MKNKKILISCNRTLNTGGIEKSLTTFIKLFNTKENEVTLILFDKEGSMFSELELENVTVIYTKDLMHDNPIFNDIKKLKLLELIKGLYYRIMIRIKRNWYENIMYTYKIYQNQLMIEGEFDCAISFTTDYSDLAIVDKVNSKKKIAFVHADASRNPKIARLNNKLLMEFDKIYCVSKNAINQFLKVHPKCKNKMDVFHNIVCVDKIIELSNKPDTGVIHDGRTVLCTVGRLSPEKGQELIPAVAAELKKRGYSFYWYIVGDGVLYENLKKQIADKSLENQVILLGNKKNPYPYIKNCDIYVQTSYTEAWCITVNEALVLEKVVVSTNFTSVEEQIQNKKNGLISEMTVESLTETIESLMLDKELYFELLKNVTVINKLPNKYDDMEKLYKYISG